jgi:Ca2+/Na+ antiporter
MNSLSAFVNSIFFAISTLSLSTLCIIAACAVGVIFIATLILCALSQKFRYADKKPFFHFCNIFSALLLALFLSEAELSRAVAIACVFWAVCYVLYGILCAASRKRVKAEREFAPVFSALPSPQSKGSFTLNIPAAKNSVRLEHALSIADKLLLKSLSKGDRQELKKMKTTLTILQIKGSLTPQEGEILNDNFNALLKLMAKYNL